MKTRPAFPHKKNPRHLPSKPMKKRNSQWRMMLWTSMAVIGWFACKSLSDWVRYLVIVTCTGKSGIFRAQLVSLRGSNPDYSGRSASRVNAGLAFPQLLLLFVAGPKRRENFHFHSEQLSSTLTRHEVSICGSADIIFCGVLLQSQVLHQYVNLVQTKLAVAVEVHLALQNLQVPGDILGEELLQVAVVPHNQTGPAETRTRRKIWRCFFCCSQSYGPADT